MYVENPDRVNLRQGDVLPEVQFISPTFCARLGEEYSVPPYRISTHKLAVVSQCCELECYENESGFRQPRRSRWLVAPFVERLPFPSGSTEIEKLRRNGEVSVENDPVQYFYYAHYEPDFGEGVIDLANIFSLKAGDLMPLTAEKVVELDTKHRHLLRQRLSHYFSRIPDEEWADVQQHFPS